MFENSRQKIVRNFVIGATVKRTAQRAYADEVVIFRTHSEILTDQRIISAGVTYRLDTIQSARVIRLAHFFPLQIARVLALALAVFCALGALGLIDNSLVQDPMIVCPLLAVLSGAFAIRARWLIPTHAIRLQTTSGRVDFVRGGDGEYLKLVLRKLNEALYAHKDRP